MVVGPPLDKGKYRTIMEQQLSVWPVVPGYAQLNLNSTSIQC
jgi:hypothetical protein